MILQYTDIFDGGKNVKIKGEITTEHCASSYGLPVLLLPDGGVVSAESWVMLGYKVVSITQKEAPMMERWLKNLYAMMGVQVAASELGKKGGSAKSERKSASSRANGAKGGRPKNKKDIVSM